MTRPEPEDLVSGPESFTRLDQEIAEAEDYRRRQEARLAGDHVPPPLRAPPTSDRPKLRHHLVIGDSHAHPDDPNHRFEWLGHMVADRCPHIVVDIGDSADMPSLFGYDRGAKGPLFEGRSYWRDIDAYLDAKERFEQALSPMKPRLVRLMGNHEDRITRFLDCEPRFRGIVGLEDLGDARLGWEVVPFLEQITLDGVVYCHYFKSPGGGDRPIGGVVPARSVILKRPGSFSRVFGHSHRTSGPETTNTPGVPVSSNSGWPMARSRTTSSRATRQSGSVMDEEPPFHHGVGGAVAPGALPDPGPR